MVILQVVGPIMSSGHSAVVGALVFPFILKLSFSITVVRKTYCDLMHASRLFFFQLTHIAFDAEPRPGSTSRFQRTLRLVYERLQQTSFAAAADDHSLHALSMIAL